MHNFSSKSFHKKKKEHVGGNGKKVEALGLSCKTRNENIFSRRKRRGMRGPERVGRWKAARCLAGRETRRMLTRVLG